MTTMYSSVNCVDDARYRCIDGSCAHSYSDCTSNNLNCTIPHRSYYCGEENGDNCVLADFVCMRPCGTKTESQGSYYNYYSICEGYPGLCARHKIDCPILCAESQMRCPNNKCVSSPEWCDNCVSGFRCQDNGTCFDRELRCNNVTDCFDMSDEWNCDQPPSNNDSEATLESIVAFVIFCLIIIGMTSLCCYVRNRRRRQRHGYSSQGTVLNANETREVPITTLVHTSPIVPQDEGNSQPCYDATNDETRTGPAVLPTAPAMDVQNLPYADQPPPYSEVVSMGDYGSTKT